MLTNVGFWGAIVQASKHLKWIFRDRKHSLWIRAPLLGLFVVLYMFSLSYFVSQLVMPHKSRGIATKPECSSNLDEVKASAGKLYANEAIVEINDIVPSSYDDSPQGDVLCKGVVVTSTAKHKVDIYWSYNNGYRVLVTEATH
ncbi:MAG: hypothetical protein ACJ763_10895 [Bdellovibrionia bacterium]